MKTRMERAHDHRFGGWKMRFAAYAMFPKVARGWTETTRRRSAVRHSTPVQVLCAVPHFAIGSSCNSHNFAADIVVIQNRFLLWEKFLESGRRASAAAAGASPACIAPEAPAA